LDEAVECRPTFEQIGHEPIIEEMGRNLNILKCLEGVIYERQTGLNFLNGNLVKARNAFDTLDCRESTLKTALDSLLVFSDQVQFQYLSSTITFTN